MKNRLIVLIPGFQEKFSAGSQLSVLKTCLEKQSQAKALPLAYEPLTGYQIKTDALTTDLFEATWQSATPMLSTMGWLVKLTWGALLLGSWVRPESFVTLRRHLSWSRWFLAMLFIIVLWWLSAVFALTKELGYSLHFGPFHFGHSDLQISFGEPFFLTTTAILAFLGVSVTASTDLADLFRRYLGNAVDANGLRTGDVIRSTVEDTLQLLLQRRKYEDVVIVGHSFGALIALDAVETIDCEVFLVTLGGFLAFLSSESIRVQNLIGTCVKGQNLRGWIDYYSDEDMFSAPSPILQVPNRIESRPVKLGAGYWQRATGKAHTMYFRNQEVQSTILDPQAALVSP